MGRVIPLRKDPPRKPGKHRKPKPEPARPGWCMSCDLGQHHPGRRKAGCSCYCGSRGS